MVVRSLLDLDVKALLEKLEELSGVKLPGRVIKVSLVRGVLHVRFSYPKGAEMEVEPLGTKAQALLFRDGETGGVTALEVVGVDAPLEELGLA